jgi:hypothetical protein
MQMGSRRAGVGMLDTFRDYPALMSKFGFGVSWILRATFDLDDQGGNDMDLSLFKAFR